MDRLKRILLGLLGERRYLEWLAAGFQTIYKTGWLGISYQDIYFLKKIIRPGFYCMDIGAHLGYFTLELSRLVQDQGKVFAIEPISKFHATLRNMLHKRRRKNVTLYQVALGGEGDLVDMGIPQVGSMKKFGYARVMQLSTHMRYVESEQVKNESGDHLFEQLPRLDFVKCDVEGLEVSVFASLLKTLARHSPILLCELADQQERIRMYEMVLPLGYRVYQLENGRLLPLNVYSDKKTISHNHYFIPSTREVQLTTLLGN